MTTAIAEIPPATPILRPGQARKCICGLPLRLMRDEQGEFWCHRDSLAVVLRAMSLHEAKPFTEAG